MTSQGHTPSVIWKALSLGNQRLFSIGRPFAWEQSLRFYFSVLYYKLSFSLQILLYILRILPVRFPLQNQCQWANCSEQYTELATRSLFLKTVTRKLYSAFFHRGLVEIATSFHKITCFQRLPQASLKLDIPLIISSSDVYIGTIIHFNSNVHVFSFQTLVLVTSFLLDWRVI